jgi:hypothetical protein
LEILLNLLRFSSIEKYVASAILYKFDRALMLKSLGNFFVVFIGSFAIGSGMGCLTALVCFSKDFIEKKGKHIFTILDDQIYLYSRFSSFGNHTFCFDVI